MGLRDSKGYIPLTTVRNDMGLWDCNSQNATASVPSRLPAVLAKKENEQEKN